MAEITLEVTRREQTGKEVAKKLRRDGKVPAVVYGGHREPVAIAVDRKSVSELIQKSEHGIRSVFLLKMAGSDQQRHAMIKDVTIDPISRRMTHIDFVRVVMDELIKVTIPVTPPNSSTTVCLPPPLRESISGENPGPESTTSIQPSLSLRATQTEIVLLSDVWIACMALRSNWTKACVKVNSSAITCKPGSGKAT